MKRFCWVLPDIGHYHHARFNAFAQVAYRAGVDSFILEVGGKSGFKEFKAGDSDSRDYSTRTLFPDKALSELTREKVCQPIWAALDAVGPDVVCVPGWGDKVGLASLLWCARTGTPSIVMSESQGPDRPRYLWKETIKRRIVASFSAGMVGGRRHFEYLISLGMEPEKLFVGCDVVDNEHFASGASSARGDEEACRLKLGVPSRYFLSCCRFVPQKNLCFLLRSYAAYRKLAGPKAWKFVVVGDGPMMSDVLNLKEELALGDALILPGLKPYHLLPAYYALAGTFVLSSAQEPWGLVVNEAMAAGLPVIVSNRCGCAADLVRHGQNGFVFDPYDEDALCHLMLAVSSGAWDLAQMGQRSREIISSWTPETFAENLWKAADAAVHAPKKNPRWTDKALLWALIRR